MPCEMNVGNACSLSPLDAPEERSSKRRSAASARWLDSVEPQGAEAVAALDVGSSWIACALADLDGIGHPVPIAADVVPSYGIRGGDIVDLARAGESIRIAIKSLGERTDTNIRSVFVGFSGNAQLSVARGELRLKGGPRAVRDGDVARLQRTLRADGGSSSKMLHRFDGPYSVGDLHGVERPVGLAGPGLAMSSTFLTAPADRVTNLVRAVHQAGVDIEGLVVEPLAVSYGALTDDERNLGVAVLDMGGGGFRGALWESGRIREVRSAGRNRAALPPGITPPVEGMEGIVRAMAQRFRISPASARQILGEYGLAKGRESAEGRPDFIEVSAVDGVGTLRIDSAEWARDLEAFAGPAIKDLRDGLRGFSSSHAGGVVLVGQGARLKGLASLVSRHFDGAPVRLGVPRLSTDCEVRREHFAKDAWPDELTGVGGCSIHGLLTFGAEQRARTRQRCASSWWGRLRLRLGRLSASV